MQSIMDRVEISDKMGLYTFAWDEGRPEEFHKMFTQRVHAAKPE